MSFQRTDLDKYLHVLELIFDTLPYVFWKDKAGKYKGANQNQATNLGFASPMEFIDKTIYQILEDQLSAQAIDQIDQQVMNDNRAITLEERMVSPVGERYYQSHKMPIHDKDGAVVGMLGYSTDITDLKKRELAIEAEQERLKKLADQVSHDIRSPLASMLMIVKACQAIPGRERSGLQEAANKIHDIANNLIAAFHQGDNNADPAPQGTESREPLLLSPLILEILTGKKYQYQNSALKFHHNFTQAGNFSFINVQPTAFKCMLSNIINNAVESIAHRDGEIDVDLDADDRYVNITVQDNGNGINPVLLKELIEGTHRSNEAGHGIGLTQVRDTLDNNEGTWTIESQEGVGTKVILTFPLGRSQTWIAESIALNDDDTVVILDDDNSIHLAWDTRFEKILTKFPHLKVHHFEQGQEAIDFIDAIPADKKQSVFLLSDYELLKQNLNGLGVIQHVKLQRAYLVTSHYANKEVRASAQKSGTKILPKQLAYDIPINITQRHAEEHLPPLSGDVKRVDAVFIDDDKVLLDSFTFFASNREIDTYHDPQHFLDNIAQYPKDTKILLDYHFNNFHQTGVDIAHQLHGMKFERLYLLSGANLSAHDVPSFLRIVPKTDLTQIEEILGEIHSFRD